MKVLKEIHLLKTPLYVVIVLFYQQNYHVMYKKAFSLIGLLCGHIISLHILIILQGDMEGRGGVQIPHYSKHYGRVTNLCQDGGYALSSHTHHLFHYVRDNQRAQTAHLSNLWTATLRSVLFLLSIKSLNEENSKFLG